MKARMREEFATFLCQYYGTTRALANIAGVCQQQTQSKAQIRKCIGILQLRWVQHPYRQSVPLHGFPHAMQHQRHVASWCTQGIRSAASVLPLLNTTFSCLVDTTSPWSVPIRVSCSTGKEKVPVCSIQPLRRLSNLLRSWCPVWRFHGYSFLSCFAQNLSGCWGDIFSISQPPSRHSSTGLLHRRNKTVFLYSWKVSESPGLSMLR